VGYPLPTAVDEWKIKCDGYPSQMGSRIQCKSPSNMPEMYLNTPRFRYIYISLGTMGTIGTLGTMGTLGTIGTLGTMGTLGTLGDVGNEGKRKENIEIQH
jgi:hypothetical protein